MTQTRGRHSQFFLLRIRIDFTLFFVTAKVEVNDGSHNMLDWHIRWYWHLQKQRSILRSMCDASGAAAVTRTMSSFSCTWLQIQFVSETKTTGFAAFGNFCVCFFCFSLQS